MIVNGQYQTEIAIADRALQYGDGCFTTIAFREGCLEFFDAHLQRLEKACHILDIKFTAWSDLTKSILDSVNELTAPITELVIKVIISRGQGGRGYSPIPCHSPSFIITHHPFPSFYGQWQQTGISLTVSPVLVAKQPLLAGIKHLNRLEQVLIKNALSPTGFDDALVCDTDGMIVETSMANIFWKEDETWFTPDLTNSGVEGVMRNQVLTAFQKHDISVQIVRKNILDLLRIDEMFICNALMGLVPIKGITFENTGGTIQVSTKQQVLSLQTYVSQACKEQGLAV